MPKYETAICLEYKNNIVEPINPIRPNIEIAILNILYAPLLSPTATLLDISCEIALGTPIEDIAKNKL